MANKVTMSPDEFMAKRSAKSPDEFMAERERELVKKSNVERKGFLEDAGEVIAPLAVAPIKGASALLDLGGKIGNTITKYTIGKEYLPENVREVNTAGLERMFPIVKPKNKAVQLASDVAENLTTMAPFAKGAQYLAKGAQFIPGLKSIGGFAEKALKGAEKFNKTNVLGETGATLLPGIVDSDDPFVNLALSIVGSYAGGKAGQKLNNKEINELAARLGIKADTPQELVTTLLDKAGEKGKAIQAYIQNLPGFGRTKNVITEQVAHVKKDLGIPEKALELNVEGKAFGKAAEKAAENIDIANAKRSIGINEITDQIGEIGLPNTKSWLKGLENKFKKQPHLYEKFKKDPFIKHITDLFKSYQSPENVLNGVEAIKRNVIDMDTLKEFIKKSRPLIESSPYGREFLRNIELDKSLGVSKNLTKDLANKYESLVEKGKDYFENVHSVFEKIKSIPAQLKDSLIKELRDNDPDKYYNLIKTVRDNVKSKDLDQFNQAVTMAIGADPKTNKFVPSIFINKFENMSEAVRKEIFGKDAAKVGETVALMKTLGKQLDPKEFNLASSKLYKVIKNLSYLSPAGFLGASALKLISPSLGIGIAGIPKGLDILNTNPALNKAVAKRLLNKQIQKAAPESSGLFDNFYKAISRAAGSRLGKE